jgi:hypothetical protein
MDGFRMYFPLELSGPEIADTLRAAGFEVDELQTRKLGVLADGNAHVWIDLSTRDELDESDLAESDSWPVSLDQLGTLVTIMVRSNDPSSKLAMEVAHLLVEKFSGLITWDGIHYWEALYIRLFPKVTPQ